MAKASVSAAWDGTRQVLGLGGGLIATVALALLVLPSVISDIAKPVTAEGAFPEPGVWMAVTAVAFVIGLIGQLSIITLALGSRATVGEAIGHGLRRAPAYIAASIMWTLPIVLLAYPLIWIVGSGTPSGAAVLGLLFLMVLFVFIFVRMLLSPAVATGESGGPLHILRRSWALTRGNWWRLFGFLVAWAIAAAVLVVAVQAISGLLSRMVFGELEPMTIGRLVVSLLTQLAGAALSVILVVMQAQLYLQLSGPRREPEVEVTVPHSGT